MSDSSLNKYLEVKKKLDLLKKKEGISQGGLQHIESQFRKDFNCDSSKEVMDYLLDLVKNKEKLSKEIEKEYEIWMRNYQEKLG